MGWQEFAQGLGLSIGINLIENPAAVSLTEAQSQAPEYALRWRYRICQKTGTEFDITQEGLFYTCGAALDQEALEIALE